jgi:hypothetical protein
VGNSAAKLFEEVGSGGQLPLLQKNQWAITFGALSDCHQLKKSVGNRFWISGQLPNCHSLDTPLVVRFSGIGQLPSSQKN